MCRTGFGIYFRDLNSLRITYVIGLSVSAHIKLSSCETNFEEFLLTSEDNT